MSLCYYFHMKLNRMVEEMRWLKEITPSKRSLSFEPINTEIVVTFKLKYYPFLRILSTTSTATAADVAANNADATSEATTLE